MMTKYILVIDDEEALRELACACLEDLGGWNVITAASGSEGLLQLETSSPDAILLDISMPEMDGFCFLEELRKKPSMQTIPIILLTAKVLPEDRARFAQIDVAGVITKPFNPTTICGQIAEMLGWGL